ncbi:MAG TPA: hypothetical protein VLE51_01915 [Candidatus Saccharimonadales bacterium]|nr:hypothetical protein [Candidatus Saccharimonadales bacterium]
MTTNGFEADLTIDPALDKAMRAIDIAPGLDKYIPPHLLPGCLGICATSGELTIVEVDRDGRSNLLGIVEGGPRNMGLMLVHRVGRAPDAEPQYKHDETLPYDGNISFP